MKPRARRDKKKAEAPPSGSDELLIVGIGASAGCLDALKRFFMALPENVGAVAFVVIVHLDPERKSNLAELLQRHTPLAVTQVTERVKLVPGHIYVIPPNKSLSIADGHLELAEFAEPRGRRAPIDLFFRALAAVPGGGVGIVLSGSGTDGTIGLRAVKEQGGLVMVQAPDDAQHDAMPRSAIATGTVDFVLPAAGLALKLNEYVRDRHRIRVPMDAEVLPKDDSEALLRILTELRRRTGHDFSNYKPSTVLRRISRRMQVNQVATLSDYLHVLRNEPIEATTLMKNLLISVTHFFRDPESWDMLATHVIAKLFRDRAPENPVRAWVPGCATGEEAYTLAMLLQEHASTLGLVPPIQIFASDLDDGALAQARQGLYPDAIVADVSEKRLARFFRREGNYYRVKKEIRDLILFTVHDLLNDPPFSRLDLISSRNVLIYVNQTLQQEIFRLYHYALRPGGYLFLGSAESADGQLGLFSPVSKKHRLYQREDGADTVLPSLERWRRVGDSGRADIDLTERAGPSPLREHRTMLERQLPPSVIVGRRNELVHLSETAGRYLRRTGGRPSNDIMQEVLPELRRHLQMALYRAFEHGRSTSTRAVAVTLDGGEGWVHLIVQPGRAEHGMQDRALVIFAEVETAGFSAAGVKEQDDNAGTDEADHRTRQLEAEVQHLREQLQATIEEYESSKEEMRAANEELQSISEEHKSTAEELETSEEELRSVNEELETVNQELKAKVEELSQTNSDLQNLMDSTEIGTLFLDRELRIHRYTPGITDLFNVRPTDTGRPITHLTHKFDYDHVVEDAERVLRDLATVEREVQIPRGSWFLMRLRPYRTIDHRIAGVVITFVDITRRREGEEALRKAEERYRLLLENVKEYAIIMLDVDGRVMTWNVGAERLFGYDDEDVLGHPGAIIFSKEDQQAGVPEREIEEAMRSGHVSDERWHVRKDGSQFWGTGVLTALYFPTGDLRGFAKVMRDNTERKEAEEMLERRVRIRTQQVRRLASALTMSEQAERRRLSQILHDDLQQIIHSIRMKVNIVRHNVLAGRQERALEHLEEAEEWLGTAAATTRRLAVDLNPPLLKSEGLPGALAWLRTQMREVYDLEVEVKGEPPLGVPNEDMQVLLVRIVRELLFNVVKHAGTNRAMVEFESAGDHVIIHVIDEGRGFVAEDAIHVDEGVVGFGLFSMRERLELFGGSLEIDSTPGRGTRVTVHTPPLVPRPVVGEPESVAQ